VEEKKIRIQTSIWLMMAFFSFLVGVAIAIFALAVYGPQQLTLSAEPIYTPGAGISNEDVLAISGNASDEFERVNVDMLHQETPVVDCRLNETTVQTRHISSVFIHQAVFRIDHFKGSDDLDRKLTKASWVNWLDWLECSLSPSINWVNKPSAIRNSGSLGHQLAIAKKNGLRTPATIFTNNQERIEIFSHEYGEVILKPGNLIGLFTPGKRILASKIDSKTIDVAVLKTAPCLFQEYIAKAYELRVHVIGEKVLTCRIESQANEKTEVDWRNYSIAETPHYPHKLDPAVTNACIQITKEMGLGLGIIDLIVTPDEEHVFLEVNSQGHWKWIEQLTELPITQTVLKYLLN